MSEQEGTRFYDTAYGRFGDDLYGAIRAEAFGEDIGQNSWLTADEQRRFCRWLELGPASDVLEVASGSGGPALFTAAETGCRIIGVDLNAAGIAAASAAAAERDLAGRARFVEADAARPLPFADASFDAVICVDAINHLYDRGAVLRDWHRLLRPGGRALLTDPVTVTGLLRRDEMIVRGGAMGEFVLTPPGLDEQLLTDAGFVVERIEDVTDATARTATAWHAARERRAADLARREGAEEHAATQRFLAMVATLAGERRLSRFAYVARKPAGPTRVRRPRGCSSRAAPACSAAGCGRSRRPRDTTWTPPARRARPVRPG